jgi:hypothetical protein
VNRSTGTELLGLVTLVVVLWTGIPLRAGTLLLFDRGLESGDLASESSGLFFINRAGTRSRIEVSAIQRYYPRLSGTAATGSGSTLPEGIILKNGTILAGKWETLAPPAVTLKPRQWKIPISEIAVALTSDTPRELFSRLKPGQRGLLLSHGDFFEGSLRAATADRLLAVHETLGPRAFARTETHAVVLQPMTPAASLFNVRLTDGTVLGVANAGLGSSEVVLQAPPLEPIRVGWTDVAEFGAGALRFLDLTTGRSVDPAGRGAAAYERVLVDEPVGGFGESMSAPALRMAAAASVTFSIPAGFTEFAARVNPTPGLESGRRLSFSVLADGRLVHRTSPIGSAPGAVPIRCTLTGARQITLRMESDAVPASGDWVRPVLFRR